MVSKDAPAWLRAFACVICEQIAVHTPQSYRAHRPCIQCGGRRQRRLYGNPFEILVKRGYLEPVTEPMLAYTCSCERFWATREAYDAHRQRTGCTEGR